MDVGIWRTSYSYPVSLVREVPGRWNNGYQSLCLLVTTNVFPNEFNLISEWFAMTGFSILCRELLFVFDLVWEWRGDCAWRGCLVTRICTCT